MIYQEQEENKPYRPANYRLWNVLLGELFDDFLYFFFPKAAGQLDMERGFTFLDSELVPLSPPEDDQFTNRHADKLVKVFTRKGGGVWKLLHIEIQGYAQENFPARMFQCFYRIREKYRRPVSSLAIFADDNKNFHPDRFEQSDRDTHLRYGFNTYKILAQDQEQLEQSDNPFALVVLTVKTALEGKRLTDEELYPLKIKLMKQLLSKQFSRRKTRAIMFFLQNYIRFENEGMNNKFEKEEFEQGLE